MTNTTQSNIIQGDEIEYLTAQDNFFIASENQTAFTFTVGGIYIFDNKVDGNNVRDQVDEFLYFPSQKRLRQVIINNNRLFSRPYWQLDKTFDIKNHFHIISGSFNKTTLSERISQEYSKQFPKNRPCWDMYWFDNYNDNGSALFFKAHHAIADGQGFVRGLLAFVSSLEDPITMDDNEDVHKLLKYRQTTLQHQQGNSFQSSSTNHQNKSNIFTRIYSMILLIISFMFGLVQFIATQLSIMAYTKKSLVKKHYSKNKQIAFSSSILLNQVKFVKNQLNLTVNDVMTSCFSLALEQYLKKKGDLKDDEFWFQIPASLRHPLDLSLSNQSVGFGIKIPLIPPQNFNTTRNFKKEYRLSRLKTVNKIMNAKKNSWDRYMMKLSMYLIFPLPNLFKHLWPKFLNFSCGKATHAILSNVPGSSTCIKWASHDMVDIIAIAPQLDSNSLGCCIHSYNGKMYFCVLMDQEDVHNALFLPGAATEICGYFESEFEAILNYCQDDNDDDDAKKKV